MVKEFFNKLDKITQLHSKNVAFIMGLLLKKLGYPEVDRLDIVEIALYHDIGKVFIPISIINKAGKLTSEEIKIVQNHTYYSKEILNAYLPNNKYRYLAYTHHEKLNGSGYPEHSSELTFESKLLVVVDVFEALLSVRSYKKSWPIKDVLEYLKDRINTEYDYLSIMLLIEYQDIIIKGMIR